MKNTVKIVWTLLFNLCVAVGLCVVVKYAYMEMRGDFKHLIAMKREHPKLIAFHDSEGGVIILRECEPDESRPSEIRANYHGHQFCEVEVSEVTSK